MSSIIILHHIVVVLNNLSKSIFCILDILSHLPYIIVCNNLLLKQFQQQQRLKTQLNLFQKEVTPRSFVDIMMTGVNKWNNGEINKTTTTSTDDKNVDSEENRDSEPTTATC